jgi:threonyl-tRNA synthetase
MQLVKREKKPVLLNFVPEGIYYWVLNIEYHIIDALERPREIATFQIDIGNAKRFGISYVDETGQKVFPTIIHTAVIGTIERYLFTVFDTCAAMEAKGKKPSLPLWLSPTQVRIIPVKPDPNLIDFTLGVAKELAELKIRSDIDDRDESLDKRVREAERNWIPYIVVVGQREMSTKSFAVRRRRDGAKYEITIPKLKEEISNLTKEYPLMPLRLPTLVSKRPGYKQL